MKTKGKAWHLIATVLLIVVFVYTAFFGVYAKYGDTTTTYIKGAKDIRFGVDIKGGVNVTFVPSDGYDATEEQLEAAQLVIENRLVALNVTDYELYVDNNSDSLILEFPWQSGETDFDPEAAIDEIGTTAYLTFREGSSADGELILDGSMIESAAAQYGPCAAGYGAAAPAGLPQRARGVPRRGRCQQAGGRLPRQHLTDSENRAMIASNY